MREEARERIHAHFEVFRQMDARPPGGSTPNLVIREGEAVPEMLAQIEDGRRDRRGSSSARAPARADRAPIIGELSRRFGTLPVPVTIVPGELSKERLEAIC